MGRSERKFLRQAKKEKLFEVQEKIKEATNLLLTPTKCFNCDNVFLFKESNHDEWKVRSYLDKTILVCKSCSEIVVENT